MAYLQVNGFRMWYDVRGSGFPILFVHGGFAGIPSRLEPKDYHWLQDMALGYRLIVYHRRGCGWSSCPQGGWGLDQQVEDAEALLAHLGIQEAHIVGSSAGGPIAILLALKRPKLVRSLVLANTSARLLAADSPLSHLVRRQLEAVQRKGVMAAFQTRPPDLSLSVLVPWEREAAKAAGLLEEWEQYEARLIEAASSLPEEERAQLYSAEVHNLAAYLGLDLRPYLGQLTMPVLIVHGTVDRVVPVEAAYELHRANPNFRLELIEGAPHGILGASQEARLAVNRFLRAVDGLREGERGG